MKIWIFKMATISFLLVVSPAQAFAGDFIQYMAYSTQDNIHWDNLVFEMDLTCDDNCKATVFQASDGSAVIRSRAKTFPFSNQQHDQLYNSVFAKLSEIRALNRDIGITPPFVVMHIMYHGTERQYRMGKIPDNAPNAPLTPDDRSIYEFIKEFQDTCLAWKLGE